MNLNNKNKKPYAGSLKAPCISYKQLKNNTTMKANERIFKTEKFSLTKCIDGYWLYDYELGYNISMRAKTERDALIEALTTYQRKLATVEDQYINIEKKVSNFINSINEEEEL